MGFPRTPFLSVAEKLPPCRQAQEHGITGGGWALVKEFPGKAVLPMAAQGGLLHECVHQTGKNFFSAEGGTWGGWAETLSLQGVQGSAAQRGAAEKSFDGFRQDRVWLRNGWIYVNLRNKTFRANADGGGAPAGPWAFLMAAGRTREEGSQNKKKTRRDRRGNGCTCFLARAYWESWR